MRRLIILAAALTISAMPAQAQGLKGFLQGLYQSVVGSEQSEQKKDAEKQIEQTQPRLTSLAGKWRYVEPVMTYSGDNLAAQIAVAGVNTQLQNLIDMAGIKTEDATLAFDRSTAFHGKVEEHAIDGTYSYNRSTGAVTMAVAEDGAVYSLVGQTSYENRRLTLVFNAKEALDIARKAAPKLNENNMFRQVAQIVDSYPGIRMGIVLRK